MPLLRLACAKHPTPEQRKRLIQSLTVTIVEELGVAPAAVNVLFEDIDPSCWGVGGVGLDEVFAARRQATKTST